MMGERGVVVEDANGRKLCREKDFIERRTSGREREREKEATNIRCKKWKVKGSGE